MKQTTRILLLIISFIFVFINHSAQANESNTVIEGAVIELDEKDKTIPLEELSIEEQDFKSKISKYYSFDKGLFKIHVNDYINVDFGAIGNVNWNINNDELHTNYSFSSADIMLTGKINDNIDYKAHVLPYRNINKKTILGDLWVRGKHKNYTAQIGRMRKPFAYEPTFSPFDLDFATRSQIGRLFGDHRDTGGKILADYKYADVALGLYASMQDRPFSFHHKGIEFDTSLAFKPLANLKNKGDLKVGGSIATGKRDFSYTNYSGFVTYNYKKFGLKSEFISKEPTFYDEKKANGFYIDGMYFLTDKLQATVRFDSYNPDSKNSDKRNNEYVAGLNYFLNNKNTMLSLNYIFSDGLTNSHKIVLQMRYKTW